MKKLISLILLPFALLAGCSDPQPQQSEVQAFLDDYTKEFLRRYTDASEAQWKSLTEIREGDSANVIRAREADEAMAAFTGSKENIEKARGFLNNPESLTPIQKKQLEQILYAAANNPQTIPDIVKERIKAENDQSQLLYGFQFMIDKKKVST